MLEQYGFCVEFDGIYKRYDQQDVIRDLTLSFPAGVTTAVVGASGSGKTTLLQLVNATVLPDRGSMKVFGERPPTTNLEGFRREIGYAVQGAGLFPHLTNAQNIDLLARLEGWALERIVQRVALLLDEMELPPDVVTRYPHELSGGQQQRVGLCRALMLRPRLLLLDEPFSAIDPITRSEIYKTFARVQKNEGVSTLLVTHDMREAVRLSGYLVILHQGRVHQHGPTADVVANPADDYVSTLVTEQL